MTTLAPATCPYGSGPKRRYSSRREAEVVAWAELARRGCWLRAFHCRCGAWHLTHWESRDWEARR